MNALEKLAELERKHKEAVASIKGEAITELAKKRASLKAELDALDAEYEALTGKKVTGAKAGGSRKRHTAEEKSALVLTVAEIIKKAHEGVSMSEIVNQTGASASAVRGAVKAVKGIKMMGDKRSALYFAK